MRGAPFAGSGSSSAATDAAWNSEYANSLGGDSALLFRAGGNIMMNFANGGLQLRHGKPVTFKTVMALTHNQILGPILSEWMLCIDTIEPTAVIVGTVYADEKMPAFSSLVGFNLSN